MDSSLDVTKISMGKKNFKFLEKLKETGFWISDDLYTKIRREGGEL